MKYNIAVEGCLHGELQKVYDTIGYIEKEKKIKVDVLLICGDFECIRNKSDMEYVAVPLKYRSLKDFHLYYKGIKKAPVLTIFIGGNHEASNHMWQLYYGGFVCENIYYMGCSSVVKIGKRAMKQDGGQIQGIIEEKDMLRIGSFSGIFKDNHFDDCYHEFDIKGNENNKRSIYHFRRFEYLKLKLLSMGKECKDEERNLKYSQQHKSGGSLCDIFMSHDWPNGIYKHGDLDDLLKNKPFLRDEAMSRKGFGNRAAMDLLKYLKPKYWFSAHLHVKFGAIYQHPKQQDESSEEKGLNTKFLALDKVIPRRDFLQVIQIDTDSDSTSNNPSESEKAESEVSLYYDMDWLSIIKSTHELIPLKKIKGEKNYFNIQKNQKKAILKEPLVDEETFRKNREWVKDRIESFENGYFKNLNIMECNNPFKRNEKEESSIDNSTKTEPIEQKHTDNETLIKEQSIDENIEENKSIEDSNKEDTTKKEQQKEGHFVEENQKNESIHIDAEIKQGEIQHHDLSTFHNSQTKTLLQFLQLNHQLNVEQI